MSGVRFELRDSKPSSAPAAILVTALEPTLLLTVSADGRVDSFVAADDEADADALVEALEQREDVGAAVRSLIRVSEAV